MKVEIWSDIMCPFCYIGKRKFEAAMAGFSQNAKVEVMWRSFQLDPEMKSMPGKSALEYLAERKGQSLEWSQKAHASVTAMAAEVGLKYNFDKTVIANSWDAHRLIQMAKSQTPSLGDAAEEALFKAYFTDGLDVSNHQTLPAIGATIGLDADDVKEMLASDQFSADVNSDLDLARQFGISGVPFFVFDRKYAVSGAQEEEVFLEVLAKSFV